MVGAGKGNINPDDIFQSTGTSCLVQSLGVSLFDDLKRNVEKDLVVSGEHLAVPCLPFWKNGQNRRDHMNTLRIQKSAQMRKSLRIDGPPLDCVAGCITPDLAKIVAVQVDDVLLFLPQIVGEKSPDS